jgi:hypothetical protein
MLLQGLPFVPAYIMLVQPFDLKKGVFHVNELSNRNTGAAVIVNVLYGQLCGFYAFLFNGYGLGHVIAGMAGND